MKVFLNFQTFHLHCYILVNQRKLLLYAIFNLVKAVLVLLTLCDPDGFKRPLNSLVKFCPPHLILGLYYCGLMTFPPKNSFIPCGIKNLARVKVSRKGGLKIYSCRNFFNSTLL